MPPTVRLRSRALTELLYGDAVEPVATTIGRPDTGRTGDNGAARAKRLRSEAARLRRVAGEYLDRAAELVAEGEPVPARRLRDLAEMSSCHYMAYDELAIAAEYRGRAGRFARGSHAHEVEVQRAYAAIRRAEGQRERGEAVRRRGDAFAEARHRKLAEEAEEKARVAELRAAELLEAQAGRRGEVS